MKQSAISSNRNTTGLLNPQASRIIPIHRESQALTDGIIKVAKEGIAISTLEGVELFKVSMIVRCSAEGNYCRITCRDGHNILASKTLKAVEQAIYCCSDGCGNSQFIRIHQSHLVNLNDIQKIMLDHVILENGKCIPVSRSKRSRLTEQMTEMFQLV